MSIFETHILVFLHIPKCAGTTLDRNAKDLFGRRGYQYWRASQIASERVENLSPKQKSKVRWLSGHFGMDAPFLEEFYKTHLYISSVRDPLDRIRSFYAYQVKKSAVRPNAWNQSVASMPFETFVRYLIDTDHFLASSNQCKILGLEDCALNETAISRFLILTTSAGVGRASAVLENCFGDGVAKSMTPTNSHRNRSPSASLSFPADLAKELQKRTEKDRELLEWVQAGEDEWLERAETRIKELDRLAKAKLRMRRLTDRRHPTEAYDTDAARSFVTMHSPYQGLPARAFWRTGVSERDVATVEGLYIKRFDIDREMKIATAGSCFAQHIARNMRARGYSVLDTEPAPPSLSVAEAQSFGFGLYSARYGNIYTTRQLLQLQAEAYNRFQPADAVWEKDGRFFDALRPSVEPRGLPSAEAVARHRADHLARVRGVFEKADVFVYTFGLTEAWIHRESGTVYPTAPGTIAGKYDPAVHSFANFTFQEIYTDFVRFRDRIKKRNPNLKFLLTVSPVPLTATASGDHVLAATTYSKSVLRAVAGQLYKEFDDVDYFPSYEIVASPFSRGALYEDNLRSVREDGVRQVMKIFFNEHDGQPVEGNLIKAAKPETRSAAKSADVVCEEALLEAFNR